MNEWILYRFSFVDKSELTDDDGEDRRYIFLRGRETTVKSMYIFHQEWM